MKALKWLVVVLAALIVLFVAISLFLPSTYAVSRSVVINAPAEKVYGFISAPAQWPKWGVWNRRDPNMKITYKGPASGAGAAWAWESKSEGNGEMTFTAADVNKRVVYKLNFPDMGMSSTGELRLAESASDPRTTTVTWTTEGKMEGFPIWRYFALVMDRLVGPDFESGLKNLKALCE